MAGVWRQRRADGRQPAGLGLRLRHAVDADHIAAIDTVTRKMMQQGRPLPSGRGSRWATRRLWCWPRRRLPRPPPRFSADELVHDTGSVIGTAVSALFLLAMAFINLVILRSVWRSFRRGSRRQGER
jgi:high-affinity nickel-transport protein